MKRHDFLFGLLFLMSCHCLGQADFRYKRMISGVEETAWYKMSLPPDIFKNLNNDLSDFRLYSVNNNDTLEVPYLLNVQVDELTRQTVHLSLFNKSTRDGILYLTFELKGSQKVNFLNLNFGESNYFALVTLEGSLDKQQWFEIVRDQRIVSIKNDVNDYALSTISFPLTDYWFLRVAVNSDTPLTFHNASFQYNKVKPGVYNAVSLEWKMRSDKKTRLSFLDIKLDDYVPLSSISVETDSTNDYYRSFRIEILRDSARTDTGWVKYYDTVSEGHLTSFKSNKFSFPWKATKEARLVIMDHDNAPLIIGNVSAAGPEIQAISYLKRGQNFMLYGSDRLGAPFYDLAYFENKIPDATYSAKLGHAQKISDDEFGKRPLFESRFWLWSLMVLCIGSLGFFTIKMMKQKE